MRQNKRLAVVGISGRMGAEILALADELGFEVVAGVSRGRKTIDTIKGSFTTVTQMSELNPAHVDVVIDFAPPENTAAVIAWCEANAKPLVSGVTGLSAAQKARYTEAGRKIAVLWAPNMSLGVAVLTRMLASLESLSGFEFQIEELHHKRKKDAPSGTALFLQEHLVKAVGPVPEPVAIRGGGIFGIHKIWAMGEEETITLEHTAMNRRVFARGALRAAEHLLSKPIGLYRMDDVL